MKKKLLAAAYALILTFTIAIAHAQSGPRFGPPPPPSERMPPPPREHPNWVWRGGFYRWSGPGGRYVWVPGSYSQPPRPGNRWQPGRWMQTPHDWVWVNGRWF